MNGRLIHSGSGFDGRGVKNNRADRKNWLLVIVLAVGLLYPGEGCAQHPFYHFEYYNATHNLKTTLINRIFQDRRGYIWLWTWDGFLRFDGYQFKEYSPERLNPDDISNQTITNVAEDSKGNFWIVYNSSRLSKFNPITEKSFVFYPKNDARYFVNKKIHSLAIDSLDRVWMSCSSLQTTSSGALVQELVRFDISDSSATAYQQLPDDDLQLPEAVQRSSSGRWKEEYRTIEAIAVGVSGTIYLGTPTGLFLFDEKSGVSNLIYRGTGVAPMVVEGHQTVWVKSDQGLVKYDARLGSIRIFKMKADGINVVGFVARKNEGQLWCVVNNKLTIFDKATETFVELDPKTRISEMEDQVINQLFVDYQENLWVAHSYGLSKSRASVNSFEYQAIEIPGKPRLQHELIGQITRDYFSGNTLFATGYGRGLVVFNQKTKAFSALNVPISRDEFVGGQFVNDIVVDSAHQSWIVTRDFLFKFKSEDNSLQELTLPLVTPRFSSAVFDDAGFLWVTSTRNGIYKINLKNHLAQNFSRSSHPEVDADYFNFSVKDVRGRLWFGTKGDGLVMYDPQINNFSSFRVMEGDSLSLKGNFITSLIISGDGKMFIGTEKGISYRLAEDAPGHFRSIEGEHYYVGSLCLESDSVLWYSTTRGIFRYDLIKKSRNRFDSNNNLTSDFINMIISKIGHEMLIGFVDGYFKYDLRNLDKDVKRMPIVITTFKVNNEERNLRTEMGKGGTVRLAPALNTLSFEFSSLDYAEPEQLIYYYKMSGVDKDWIEATEKRYASYTDLAGGDYTFQAKYVTAGSNKESIISVPVVIMIPFYKVWWFKALEVFAGLLLLLLIFSYYVKFLRNQHKKETAFSRRISELQMDALRIQINPHFLFNALNSVNRFIIKGEKEASFEFVAKLSKVIRRILENAGEKAIPLREEIEILKMYIELERSRLDERFDYTIEISPGMNPDKLFIPTMIIQPYVENAIWHGLSQKKDQGTLLVSFSGDQHIMEIVIEDNGAGRMASKGIDVNLNRKKSLGHEITNERLRIFNSLYNESSSIEIIDLKFTDGSSRGTRVEICLHLSSLNQ